MDYQLKEEGQFKYIEAGEGKPLILLHGLFGALSNFRDVVDHFSKTCSMFSQTYLPFKPWAIVILCQL